MFQFKIHYKNYTAVPGIIPKNNNNYTECFKIYKDNLFVMDKPMSITSKSTSSIKQFLIDLDTGKTNTILPDSKNNDKDTYEIYKNGELILIKNLNKNYNIKDLIN